MRRFLSHVAFLIVLTLQSSSSGLAWAEPAEVPPEPVDADEYPVYDRVVDGKFLTSRTETVYIGRVTVTRLGPEEKDLPTKAYFQERQLFPGRMEPALLTDFIIKNSHPGRLEEKFNFGRRYRFVPGDGDGIGGPEVSLSPIPAGFAPAARAQPVQEAPRLVGLLRFSRVGFSPRRDQALVYVEEDRPDGTGGGLLMLLSRSGQGWEFLDTEVLWFARPD